MQQVWDAALPLCFLGMQHGGMEDAEWLENLGHHRVPQVGGWTRLALEETVHGCGQDESLGTVVAQHFLWPPLVLAIGKADSKLLLSRAGPHPSAHLRLVFIGEGLVGLPQGCQVS